MIFGSVCSGIEAASCAWYPLGWEAAFVSEIEPFPCSVLKHHYPEVPNYGDMTKFQEWPDARISVLVGGTPCQSFSVAGLRKGLADPRGNLMLTYLAIADQYRPEWLVWENVPGVLSSNGGRDFASFLRGLAELGYGFAYRILDAQYLGVAQRRRRVFVVGHIGDWRRAAAVLFERHSLQGHPAPRREAGKRVAGTVKGGSGSRGYPDPSDGNGGGLVAGTIGARTGLSIGAQDAANGHMIGWPAEVAPSLDAHFGDKMGLENQHINGGGDGLSEVSRTLNAGGMGRQDWETETLIPTNGGGFDGAYGFGAQMSVPQVDRDLMQTLGAKNPMEVAFPINTQIAMRHEAMGESTGMGIGGQDDPAFTLQSAHSHAVAFDLAQITSKTNRSRVELGQPASTLNAAGQMHTASSMQVRRLTPRECERLQGFPDDYTLVQHRNKPAADGPRYKALGNSMAVPVMAWIGRRIAMVEQLKGASLP